MTINELYDKLEECVSMLDQAGIDDDAKLDLDLLKIQIKRQIRLAVLDPLKDVESVTVADLSKLTDLIREVQQEIHNESKRTKALQKIIGLVKIGANAAGIPI